MRTVNIHEAKTHLSRFVEEAAAGEEIIIAKAGRPVARLLTSASRKERTLKLRLLPETFAVVRLDADARVPQWVDGKDFVAIVRTRSELSIVCRDEAVAADLTEVQRNFRGFAVAGPLSFELTGIIAALAQPLAAAAIPILTISTYDTDYIFIRADRLDAARRALNAAGHGVLE